jgi:hypothetical protein
VIKLLLETDYPLSKAADPRARDYEEATYCNQARNSDSKVLNRSLSIEALPRLIQKMTQSNSLEVDQPPPAT